jgi:hypothetical protein
VVNFDPTNTVQLDLFRAKYGIPASFPTNKIFGPYKGKLANSSGSIELMHPDWPQGPAHPEDFAVRLVPYYLVDRVKYYDKAPWPTNADGRGFSLQRLKPEEYGNDADNWVEAVPTPGRSLVQIDYAQSTGDTFVLGFNAVAGSSYSVQVTNLLGGTNWAKLMDFDAQTNTTYRTATDTNVGAFRKRFYRVVTPKQP